MYTDAMKRAVRSITPPKGFGVDIIDNEHFITVRADEKSFMNLFDRDKRVAVEYMVRVKKPNSKLQTAVTTKPSKLKPGSKDAKRRKSFCARSAGQMKMWPKAAKDPDSRLRLARKKWNC